MWFNNEPNTTERSKVKHVIYVYNESRTFPKVQVLLSNVAKTIEFFDKRNVIFPQLKCTSVVLKSDVPPQHDRYVIFLQLNESTIGTRLKFRTKKLLREAPIFPHQMYIINFDFRSQSRT